MAHLGKGVRSRLGKGKGKGKGSPTAKIQPPRGAWKGRKREDHKYHRVCNGVDRFRSVRCFLKFALGGASTPEGGQLLHNWFALFLAAAVGHGLRERFFKKMAPTGNSTRQPILLAQIGGKPSYELLCLAPPFLQTTPFLINWGPPPSKSTCFGLFALQGVAICRLFPCGFPLQGGASAKGWPLRPEVARVAPKRVESWT